MRRCRSLWLLAAATLMLLAGCRSSPPGNVPAAPPLSTLPYSAENVQTMHRFTSELTATFSRGGRQQTMKMIVIVEQHPDSLRIAGVSPAGIPLFTITLSGNGALDSRQFAPASGLSPERMLADLQLCLWPIASLEAGLPAQWSVQQTGKNRSLLHAHEKLIDVEYDAPPTGSFAANAALSVVLEHRKLGYRIDVRPLRDRKPSDPSEDQ